MGFLRRRIADRLAERINRTYLNEATRLRPRLPATRDPEGIYEAHHLIWRYVESTVFRGRGAVDALGLVPAKQIEVVHLYALGAMHGVGPEALDSHQAQLNDVKFTKNVDEFRRALDELNKTGDPERRSYLIGFCHFVRSGIPRGRSAEADDLVDYFLGRYIEEGAP